MTSGTPRTSSGSASGAVVYVGPALSSGRRSRASPFGASPAPHESGPRVPVVGRWRNSSTPVSGPTTASVPVPNAQLRTVAAGCGKADVARHRPGDATGKGTGGVYSCSNQTTAGSSSHPFETGLRCRSKNRAISWSSSRFGPGYALCGHECTQFPTSVCDGAGQRPCIRNAGSTYESCQPPTLKIGTSIAS